MSERALVHSPDGRVPKILRDYIDGRVQLVPTAPESWSSTDYYLSTVALSAQVEKAGSSVGATIVIMPEGSAWLNEQILAASGLPRLFVAKRRGDRP